METLVVEATRVVPKFEDLLRKVICLQANYSEREAAWRQILHHWPDQQSDWRLYRIKERIEQAKKREFLAILRDPAQILEHQWKSQDNVG